MLLRTGLVLVLLLAGAPAADLAELIRKANKGDAQAQFELGRRYAAGEGVGKDDATALAWFEKAAAQDHAGAEVGLGSIYAHGFGVPQNQVESIRWYRKAALQGDRTALHNLGLDAAHGHGMPKDESAAATWFRLAAEQGHARAQFNLGELHEQGKGVPQSDFEAYVLYSLASRHENQVRIFGEVKAKEVVTKRDRVAGKLSAEQRASSLRRVAAAEALAAAHPRRFGTAVNVEKIRGWYIWKKFDPDTWQAEVAREQDQEVFQVRVLPWATSYRYLNYGVRPDELLPGERVNLFFSADENHPRGYVTHFQDEIGQMKGHGHAWKVRSVSARGFVAVGMAGEKPIDGRELAFDLDSRCRVWKAGKVVEGLPYAAADRVLLTWVLRGKQRVAVLVTDDASLESIQREQAERLGRATASEGVAGQVQTVEGDTVHLMVFATRWSQAGRSKEKQTVRLMPAGKGLRPAGEGVVAEMVFRKNRGVYGSGPTDVLLRLRDPADAKRVREWTAVVRLVGKP
jgi:hypothetical protein